MLDTRRSIATPEGVELGLRLAGPVVRGYAWMIDLLIRFAVYIGLGTVVSIFGSFGMGIYLIIVFLMEWFYPVIFELYNNGATPGKRSMGIKVVHDDGTEVTLQSSLLRNLLRSVDFLPVFYGIGLFCMLFNREFKRLGDITAGTIVVYQDKLAEASDIVAMAPKTPPVPLTPLEQKAIIQYAERVNLFTPQRSSELANILKGVTREQDEKAVQTLLQYANWMMGRR